MVEKLMIDSSLLFQYAEVARLEAINYAYEGDCVSAIKWADEYYLRYTAYLKLLAEEHTLPVS